MARLVLCLAGLALAAAQQKASFAIPVGCVPAKTCTVCLPHERSDIPRTLRDFLKSQKKTYDFAALAIL